MKDDYTTNSHYLTFIYYSLGRLGEMYSFELGNKG